MKIKIEKVLRGLDASLPCKVLCNAEWMKRPHIGCLTCTTRRYNYNHDEKDNFIKTNSYIIVVNRGVRGPLLLPKKCGFILLTVNKTKKGWLGNVRDFVLHQLVSVCELLANY